MTTALLLAALLAATPAPAGTALGLDDAVGLARGHHPDLRSARETARAAAADADEAGAALLPQLGATAAWQWQARSAPGLGTAGAGTWSAQGTADVLVWDFGKTPATARAARSTATAERETASEAERTVVRAARLAYFEARARRALVDVARATEADQEAQLARVKALVEAGSRPTSDLARARSDLAQARLVRVQAEQQRAVAAAQLAQALGVERSGLEAGDDRMPPVEGEGSALAVLLEAALQGRPSYRALDARVRAQEAARDAARSAFLPRLSAGATAGSTGEALDGLDRSWSAGLTASWSLWDGGATSARARAADARKGALEAERDAARQVLRTELEQALTSVAGGRESLTAAREALAAAAEDRTLAEARYEVGAGTLLDVSTARASEATAAGQVVIAERDLDGARAELARALGV